jgi:CRP-like cAMP-binding protein
LAWLPDSGEQLRKTSAVVIEPSTVDGIAVDEFATVLRADAQFARAFARAVTQRLAETEQELTELTFPGGWSTKELAVLVDVGLVRVAHKTVTLAQPKAFPYLRARRREPG